MLETLSPRYQTKARYRDNGEYDGEDIVSFNPAGLTDSELEHLRLEIDKVLAPLSREEIVQEISLLRTVTRSRDQSPMDAKAMLLIYAQDLADVPGLALKRAILEIRQTSTWFPTVAEIRALAEKKYQRAKVARAAINGTTTSRVFAQVRKMPGLEDKQRVRAELSQNWPDPKARKTVEVKPIYVPGGPGTLAAEEARTSKEGEAA